MADLKISQLTGATTPLAGTETLPVVQSSTTKKVSVADLTNGRLVNAATLQTSGTAAGSFSASKWIVQTEDTTATRSYACGPNTSTFGTFEFYLAKSNGGPQLGLGMFSTYSVLRAAGVGGVKVDTSGDVSAEAGNFKFDIAAKGVNFTANTGAAGMTSQLLNWYEEGTFTPTYTSTGTPPTVTYSHQYGKYTRIGRQVFFTIEIGTNSATAGTGLLAVGGLPFAAVNDRYTGTFSIGYADNFTTAAPSGGYVFAGETIARLTYEASATSKTEMLTTFLTAGTGKNYLIISGSYIV